MQSSSLLPSSSHTREIHRHAVSGWFMLLLNLGLIFGGIAAIVAGIRLGGVLMTLSGFISLFGHFALQPNEARVLILFGSYHGTVRDCGFFWGNPFYARVRARVPVGGSHGVAVHNPSTGS
ncbi:MAG: hypothetical protein ACOYMN_05665, partial [Roseimicrobium sp.]